MTLVSSFWGWPTSYIKGWREYLIKTKTITEAKDAYAVTIVVSI
jgi:hypothetical protein